MYLLGPGPAALIGLRSCSSMLLNGRNGSSPSNSSAGCSTGCVTGVYVDGGVDSPLVECPLGILCPGVRPNHGSFGSFTCGHPNSIVISTSSPLCLDTYPTDESTFFSSVFSISGSCASCMAGTSATDCFLLAKNFCLNSNIGFNCSSICLASCFTFSSFA